MNEIKAGLIGISGYAGMELARILALHPAMRLAAAYSRADAGKRLGDYYPFLRHLPGSDVVIDVFDAAACAANCDVAFLAVPAGTAMQLAPELLRRGVKVVDLSADFRLRDAAVYEAWYKGVHCCPELLSDAVYGLPELHATEIATARLVANPGCYPTSVILGLHAALKHGLIDPCGIIIDSKSGASGAGRKAAIPNLFCEISDDFRGYGAVSHRHTPEIEQELGAIANSPILVQFTPHLVPMSRGILSTIYARLAEPQTDISHVLSLYAKTWEKSSWIRVLPHGTLPQTKNTRGSMFCDIGLAIDKRTGRLLIFSAIDNLCRGASGQAVANANLMCGLAVDCGLERLCPLP